ncbi:hypothetical protein C922_02054 [Plasmodium inui San Antonio 1]|uniref:Uncharacterized protein n=1 Tax=Plasmodium inui San Antonio 1 TaxID=1237626 RepID=W7A7S8_9APIC|nr:hypothetical protein C922_02054 [Plasmodium inui San Antonio 1]EUD67348.1 hypothetical protein C922_02054 [Plasmodium inui San Antonio 1]
MIHEKRKKPSTANQSEKQDCANYKMFFIVSTLDSILLKRLSAKLGNEAKKLGSNTNIENTNIANTNIANTNIANTNIANTNITNTNIANTNIVNTNIANTDIAKTNGRNN